MGASQGKEAALFQMLKWLIHRLGAGIVPKVEPGLHFETDGRAYSEVRLLRVSKPGNVILVGKWGDRRVKIYQTFGDTHAGFIHRACELLELRDHFPAILQRDGRHIVAEWIEGRPLTIRSLVTNSRLLERFVDLQVAVHRQQLGGVESGFDYVDFLVERFHRFRGILPLTESLERVLTLACDGPTRDMPMPRLSHPDLTPSNVVIERTSGRLVLVDNEALTQSPHFLLDLFITHHSVRNPSGLSEQYVALQREQIADLTLPTGWALHLLALWVMRLAGAMFQAGQYSQAYNLADRMARGEFEQHPVFVMLREREVL